MSAQAPGRGRPLRFLGAVMAGWVAVRVMMLWPHAGSLPAAIREFVGVVPRAEAAPRPPAAAAPAPPRAFPGVPAAPMPARTRRPQDLVAVRLAYLNLFQFGDPEPVGTPLRPGLSVTGAGARDRAAARPLVRMDDRWSVSGWLSVRPGAGRALAPGESQLGGSQAGVRAAYVVDPRRRVALFARVTSPLSGTGREAALGFEWQPLEAAPVRLLAEERFALDGGEGGTGLGLVAGIDRQVPGGFRLESYGQAGVILRHGANPRDPYADGAARATRPVAAMGGVHLSLGGGAWGAAQRDAQRLDLGPSATLAAGPVRIAIDWRERVAGDARPGSGLALTLSGDF